MIQSFIHSLVFPGIFLFEVLPSSSSIKLTLTEAPYLKTSRSKHGLIHFLAVPESMNQSTQLLNHSARQCSKCLGNRVMSCSSRKTPDLFSFLIRTLVQHQPLRLSSWQIYHHDEVPHTFVLTIGLFSHVGCACHQQKNTGNFCEMSVFFHSSV